MNAFQLQEATTHLERLRHQSVQALADHWQAEQREAQAVINARSRDLHELEQLMQCEQSYTSTLQQWRVQQSEAAEVALRLKKTWCHQLVLLLACLLSCGLILLLEKRAVQTLQSTLANNPPLGHAQRNWVGMLSNVRRKIDALRTLQDPRPTAEMRRAQQEVSLLRKKRDMLEHQILLQEGRIDLLRHQASS